MRGLVVATLLIASGASAEPAPAPPPSAPPTPAPTASAPPPAGSAQPAPPPGAQPPYPYAYPPGQPPPPYPYAYPYPYVPVALPPAQLPYKEGDPVPTGYHKESRVRRGPIVAGTIMGGSTYLINLLVAGVAEGSNDTGGRVTMLYIPGVGTWGYVSEVCDRSNDGDSGCSFLVLHSLTHSIGVALIIFGIASPKTVLVRDDVSLTLAPVVGKSLSGVGLRGSF